ncbi:MAG: aminoglycoside phosphotransferase family protein [Oscillospiraceae bacterium]|jgi:hypothetical protein|nr:aminoglycoside phosphotransferase family protein [Oscillospiraceae bacterium]
MEIKNIIHYLVDKRVFYDVTEVNPITVGASGARLFSVIDGEQKYVLKHTHESSHQEKRHIHSYQKELLFYELNQRLKLPYVPDMIYSERHSDYGILLVMRYYSPLLHDQWTSEMQKSAVDLCAKFNSIAIEQMGPLGLSFQKTEIDKAFTEKSYQVWKGVLAQHRGCFDEVLFEEIYKNIDIVCPVLNDEPHYVCHGDFHPENLLYDDKNLYICDFQNIDVGKAIGDISFFISRGTGFAIKMDTDALLDYYCEKLSEYKGIPIDRATLIKERCASAVLNIFSFWAYHLKNCSYERVSGQFNEMVKSYQHLKNTV